MGKLSQKKLFDLLGSRDIPGTPEELKLLAVRIRELIELNGEQWVRENSQRLLSEWAYALRLGLKA